MATLMPWKRHFFTDRASKGEPAPGNTRRTFYYTYRLTSNSSFTFLLLIGLVWDSPEIGDMPRVALGPRTDLPSVDRPSKISKCCHYMYTSDLGKRFTYLEDPGYSKMASGHKKLHCTNVGTSAESRRTDPSQSDPASLRTSLGISLSTSYAIICPTWPIYLLNWGPDFEPKWSILTYPLFSLKLYCHLFWRWKWWEN